MNAWSIVLFGVIGILLAMAIVVFIPKTCTVARVEEGFQVKVSKKCPTGTKSYVDRNGNINCCRGAISGYTCEGKIECSFSSNSSNIKFCS